MGHIQVSHIFSIISPKIYHDFHRYVTSSESTENAIMVFFFKKKKVRGYFDRQLFQSTLYINSNFLPKCY